MKKMCAILLCVGICGVCFGFTSISKNSLPGKMVTGSNNLILETVVAGNGHPCITGGGQPCQGHQAQTCLNITLQPGQTIGPCYGNCTSTKDDILDTSEIGLDGLEYQGSCCDTRTYCVLVFDVNGNVSGAYPGTLPQGMYCPSGNKVRCYEKIV
jgi:hypothetical protein